MTMLSASKLQPGDEVYWLDPDEGECSDYYMISNIEIDDDICKITDDRGRYIEVYYWEIN